MGCTGVFEEYVIQCRLGSADSLQGYALVPQDIQDQRQFGLRVLDHYLQVGVIIDCTPDKCQIPDALQNLPIDPAIWINLNDLAP